MMTTAMIASMNPAKVRGSMANRTSSRPGARVLQPCMEILAGSREAVLADPWMKHHAKFCHELPRTGLARARGLREKIPDMVQENAYIKHSAADRADLAARAIAGLVHECCRAGNTEPGPHELRRQSRDLMAAHEVNALWSDFTNAPKFMESVDAVSQ